jgi:hypothetical protein
LVLLDPLICSTGAIRIRVLRSKQPLHLALHMPEPGQISIFASAERQLAQQGIRDFDFDLRDLPGELIPAIVSDRTVIQGTLWFSTLMETTTTRELSQGVVAGHQR